MTVVAPPNDTIVARASGGGRAGVAVYRLSGPGAFDIALRLAGALPKPRRAALCSVCDGTGDLIDRGLVLPFKGPASFTGEDVVEFHLHGGRAVEAAFLDAAAALGARAAAPGEFTRRALWNGKLDLAQVEALSDIIDAETSFQRLQALGQFGGRLSERAEAWRRRLVAILAPLEAGVDFPDEEDVPATIGAKAVPEIDALSSELEDALMLSVRARTIRDGVSVAIVGPPNAGKSSLLNRLAGSEVAIVSERPGTTRDVLETRLDLGGLPVLLADTAGLRGRTEDEIEAEGMRRARLRAEESDIRVLVLDVSQAGGRDVSRETEELLHEGDFLVWNKSDLAKPPSLPATKGLETALLSAKTGEGVEDFIRALSKAVAVRYSPGHEAPLTRLRHVQAVERALQALKRARARAASAPELAAEDARLAARALGEITGAVGVEDVLDEIFSRFCIGK
jgi:tRNA modification GTPase